jgi:multicomponent Na+:H+ antiporter subunit E
MGYAAALIAGAAALWLTLSPDPFSMAWAVSGAAVIAVTLGLAFRMKLLDREGAPYMHAPGAALFLLRRAPAMIGANLSLLTGALALDPKARPGLLRLKTRPGDDLARGLFVNSLAMTPGLIAVDVDEDSILIHALDEDDADEEELRAAETKALRATQGAPKLTAAPAPQAGAPA